MCKGVSRQTGGKDEFGLRLSGRAVYVFQEPF